jgi:hypothetical protein
MSHLLMAIITLASVVLTRLGKSRFGRAGLRRTLFTAGSEILIDIVDHASLHSRLNRTFLSVAMFCVSYNRRSRLFSRLASGVGGGLVAVGLLLAVSGESAEASCGHYVKRLGPGFMPAKTVDTRPDASQAALPTEPTERPGGCHGPECRGTPLLPVPSPAPAPQRTLSQQDLAASANADFQLTCPAGELFDAQPDRMSSGHPQRLDRPPIA